MNAAVLAPVRLLIVEDEPLQAARLQRLSEALLSEQLSALRVVNTLLDAELWIDQREIDLCLLDLNLHGHSGFDLLGHCNAGAFHTIVVSAETQQAVRAFEHGVIDFVAKPYTQARLAAAFDRYRDVASAGRQMALLAFKVAGELRTRPLAEVTYFQADDNYTRVHFADGTEQLHSKSLGQIEPLLPVEFVRIHRSYVVRQGLIAKLLHFPGSRYEAELRNGVCLPISRQRYPQLKADYI